MNYNIKIYYEHKADYLNIGNPFRAIHGVNFATDSSPLSSCLYNECELGTHNCGDGDCEDTERSHKCHCHSGYRNKNEDISKTCENINECENVDQYCRNGKCSDEEGDYNCNCNEGFMNKGGGTRQDNLDSTCVPSKYM